MDVEPERRLNTELGPSGSEEDEALILTPESREDEDREDGRGTIDDGDEGIEMRDLKTATRYDEDMDDGRKHRSGEYDADYAQGEDDHQTGRSRRRAASASSTVASFQLYTPDEEAAVVRKFDRRLVVFLALLYMLSFLDRSNIGNALIAGMDEDLQSNPRREDWYEWCLTSFYIAYIAFEWMSLLWRIIPAHIYVSIIVLSWGLTASLQAVSTSYPMLIFLRTLLGIGEAGFTGIPFYLSFFFKRNELAFRTAIFISAAPLATTFASSLAWLIIKLGQSGPIAPWRLLFLLEGFPSVLIAVAAWHIIPDSPQTASYLTPREKKVARLRLRHEQPRRRRRSKASSSSPDSSGLSSTDVFSVLLDPIAWLTAVMFFLANMAYSSLPVFLPTILTSMGHTSLTAQALSAPPYLSAFLIVLATAHASDAQRMRSPLLIAHALFSAVGYGVLAQSKWPLGLEPGSMLRYAAVYPAAIGFFNVVVLLIAWGINNQRGESRQGGAFALFQVVGQCGPLVGTRLYPEGEGPYYERGMWVMTGAMLGVAVLAGVLRVYLGRLNRRLDEADGKGEGEEEERGLVGGGGRRRDGFRYML